MNDSTPSVLKDSLQFQLYQHAEKKRRIIAAESGKLQFVGTDFGELAGSSSLARYVVARPTKEKDDQGNFIVEVSEAAVFGLDTTIMKLDSEEILTQKSSRVLSPFS